MTSSETAVLLDIDGTLVDSTYHHALAWQRAFGGVGLDVPLWRIHRTVGMGGDKLVAAVTGDEVERRHGDELRDRWRELYAEMRHEVTALPGAADLVRDLDSRGHVVALASSGDPQFAQEAVALLGVEDQVQALTTTDDAEESKPHPSLVEETLRRLPGTRRAVLVGDTPYDVESAAHAGLACVGLLCGGYSRAELEEAGAVLVVESPGDLVGLDWDQHLRPVGGSSNG
ncbi:HAD family hydrolase [Nocardioides aequoreus]|uniref:HAD family hydrolase n=1 Tax=Nocardioides aequoreus TaxID=397278 RepID=UPI0004C32F5D|nr:HAD family hydrolase [Nocardioides aequoreus]